MSDNTHAMKQARLYLGEEAYADLIALLPTEALTAEYTGRVVYGCILRGVTDPRKIAEQVECARVAENFRTF